MRLCVSPKCAKRARSQLRTTELELFEQAVVEGMALEEQLAENEPRVTQTSILVSVWMLAPAIRYCCENGR